MRVTGHSPYGRWNLKFRAQPFERDAARSPLSRLDYEEIRYAELVRELPVSPFDRSRKRTGLLQADDRESGLSKPLGEVTERSMKADELRLSARAPVQCDAIEVPVHRNERTFLRSVCVRRFTHPARGWNVECGMGDAEDEPAVRPQDPMQFAERSVQPADVLEDHVRDDEIERAGRDCEKFREVAPKEADPERVASFVRLRHFEEPGRHIHADDQGSSSREDTRQVSVSTARVKDPLASNVPGDRQKDRVDDPLAVDVALLGIPLDPPTGHVVPPLPHGRIGDAARRTDAARPPPRDSVGTATPPPSSEILGMELPRMPALVFEAVPRPGKARVPPASPGERGWTNPKTPTERRVVRRTPHA